MPPRLQSTSSEIVLSLAELSVIYNMQLRMTGGGDDGRFVVFVGPVEDPIALGSGVTEAEARCRAQHFLAFDYHKWWVEGQLSLRGWRKSADSVDGDALERLMGVS